MKSVSLLSVVCLMMLAGCSPNSPLLRGAPTPSIPIDLPLQTQGQLRDFDLMVKTMQANYIDQKAVEAWILQTNDSRSQVSSGMDSTSYIATLSTLLSTLHNTALEIIGSDSLSAPTATTTISSTITGIGIIAGMPEEGHDRVLVMHVFADSPAADAGLMPHDAIIKIDGAPVTASEGNQVISRLRGPVGSKVALTIHTPSQVDREVQITRRNVVQQSTFVSKQVPATHIGYIAPDDASVSTMHVEVAQAIRDLSTAQGVDGLILDLRTIQNPAFPLTDMLELFSNGFAGTLITRTGKTKIEITGKNVAGSQVLPLVILVSDQTRGIVESFAGMLQDQGRAHVVGYPTLGHLAVLTSVRLPNTGTVLVIPSGEYRGTKDHSWNGAGIKPDVASNLKWEEFSTENDPQFQLAVDAFVTPKP